LTSCSHGLNLTAADTVVFAELCWSPSAIEQAEARVHRLGQSSSHVAIHYLCAAKPDEQMFGSLVRKTARTARVVDGGATIDSLGDAVTAPAALRCDMEARKEELPPARETAAARRKRTCSDHDGDVGGTDGVADVDDAGMDVDCGASSRRKLEFGYRQAEFCSAGSSSQTPIELDEDRDPHAAATPWAHNPASSPLRLSSCPHCRKDLCELGPLRKQRHVAKCSAA